MSDGYIHKKINNNTQHCLFKIVCCCCWIWLYLLNTALTSLRINLFLKKNSHSFTNSIYGSKNTNNNHIGNKFISLTSFKERINLKRYCSLTLLYFSIHFDSLFH